MPSIDPIAMLEKLISSYNINPNCSDNWDDDTNGTDNDFKYNPT